MQGKLQQALIWGGSVLIAIALLLFGASPNAIALSANQAFQSAYEHRYTWDNRFPGYSAEVSLNYQGTLDQGIIRVNPDLSVEVMNLDTDEIREFVKSQLQMESIHRRSLPFEQLHSNHQFELEGADETGALKIRELGDDKISFYKVKNDIITQVNRTMGDIAVTVDTIGTAKTPLGYLVTQFQTTFRDAETGEVLERQDVRDFHEKIGNWYLLTYRAIRNTSNSDPGAKLTPDIILRFNSIQPLRMPGSMVSPV